MHSEFDKKYRLTSAVKKLFPRALQPVARDAKRRLWQLLHYHHLPRGHNFESTVLKCKITYNRYGGYCVPVSSQHRDAARTLLAHGVYEPETIEFIRSKSSSGDIIHAGAYFGDFLPALSHGLSAGSLLWAFEPNPENFMCARITTLINGLKNVKLFHGGLGAEDKTALMQIADESGALGGGSFFSDTQSVMEDSISNNGAEVPLIMIDSVIPPDRKISVLQLDVEGYETAALKGGMATIRRNRPILILENWPGSSLLSGQWFHDSILSLGYRQSGSLHGNVILSCQP